MNEMRTRVADSLHIVGAIVAKDILDALRNRTILFNILTVCFMMAGYQLLLPVIFADEGDLVVYDPGGSRLVAALENSPPFVLHRAASVAELQEEMGSKPRGELGLAAPADFDQRLASAASDASLGPTLDGYVLWSSRFRSDQLKSDMKERLARLLGQPVHIHVVGAVYPQPDAMSPIRLVSATVVVMIILMGSFTVPHLMFEEKRTKTLDALLVSPANIRQVVVGKALAGLFYCLTTAIVVFVFNWTFVTHWGLAIVAVLSGTLLAVALGLLMGTFFQDRHQMMAWAIIPGQFLLGPVFLSVFDVILPQPVRTAIYWIPTVALARLLRYSLSVGASLAQVLFYLAIVVVATALVLSLIVWKVQKADR